MQVVVKYIPSSHIFEHRVKLRSVKTTDGIVDRDTVFLCNFQVEAPLLQEAFNQC